MGAGKRHQEKKLCPLCIEVLDVDERTHFPCPCGYQVCVFCLDRLKKEYGNRCPGCRTEYGSKISPFAKRAASSSNAATPSPTDSPAAMPAPAAVQPPPQSTGLTPLEQARNMHRAAQHAKRQAAAVQQSAHPAAAQRNPASQAAPQQQQQQARPAAPQPQQLTQQQLLSVHDVVVQPTRNLAHAGWASPQQQQQPIGSSPYNHLPAIDSSALQSADWLARGSGFAAGNGSSDAPGLVANGASHTASGMHGAGSSGSSGSPWGNGVVSPASGGEQQVIAGAPRRTAVPLRPLPLEGGPVAAADPGAEAELTCARLAVQCGQSSASDAAWKLLSARTSLRTA